MAGGHRDSGRPAEGRVKHRRARKEKHHEIRLHCLRWEYDESAGYPEGGIAPGTPWSEVPEDFECPLCGVGKESFEEA